MVGRTRSEGNGNANTVTIGQWIPNGSYVRYSDVWQNVCHDRTNPGPPYKSGGSLYIEKVTCNHYPSAPVTLDNSLWGRYQGAFIVGNVPPNWYWGGALPGGDHFYDHNAGAFMAENNESLDAQGSIGWDRAKPGKPIVDLGQFIGELHAAPALPLRALTGTAGTTGLGGIISGIQSLPKRNRAAVDYARGAGSEYLNWEFGWKPILNDLRKMLNFQKHLHRRLAQLKRDNGKPIRRSVTLVDIEDVLTNTWGTPVENPFYPYVHPFYHVNGSGTSGSKVIASRKDWFEARFRYWIPDIESPDWPARAQIALLGANPTPDLLWNLLPWSWLIDWFYNVGSVISNMSENAAENLVAEYAYVMSHVKYSTHVLQQGTLSTKNGPVKCTAKAEYTKELKRRSYANPYGFGLTPGDLSGRQKAILGALGISRA